MENLKEGNIIKHKQKLGYTVMGMLMAFILSATVPVVAASSTKTLNAYYNNIKVVVNGQPASLRLDWAMRLILELSSINKTHWLTIMETGMQKHNIQSL